MINGSKLSFQQTKKLKIRMCIDCMKGKMRAFSTSASTSKRTYNPLGNVCVNFKGYFYVAAI